MGKIHLAFGRGFCEIKNYTDELFTISPEANHQDKRPGAFNVNLCEMISIPVQNREPVEPEAKWLYLSISQKPPFTHRTTGHSVQTNRGFKWANKKKWKNVFHLAFAVSEHNRLPQLVSTIQ